MTGFTGETILEVKINNEVYKIALCELLVKVESNESYLNYSINTPNGFIQLKNINKLGLQRVAIINKKFKCCFNLKFLTNKDTNSYCEIKHLVNHSKIQRLVSESLYSSQSLSLACHRN
jgi:hypothetical protein